MRKECPQCPAEDELAKQMPMTNRNRYHVWSQAMATGGS